MPGKIANRRDSREVGRSDLRVVDGSISGVVVEVVDWGFDAVELPLRRVGWEGAMESKNYFVFVWLLEFKERV